MDLFSFIKEKSLLIIPDNLKLSVLKNKNKLFDLKCLTKEEFIKKMTFEYTVEAVDYLIDNYHYTVENSYQLLNKLIYLEDKKYSSSKLNAYQKIKKDLIDKSLIKIDSLFYQGFKDKPVFVYGYKYIDNFFKNQLTKFNYQLIEESKDSIVNVIEVFHQDNSMDCLFNKVFELIDQSVSLNKIKIGNISQQDFYLFKRLADIYKLKISYSNNCVLSDLPIVKNYLKLLKQHSISESILLLKNVPEEIFNKIITISNNFLKSKNYYQLIKHAFAHTNYKDEVIDPILELVNIPDFEIASDEYLLIYNLSKDSIDSYQDDDFFTDLEKEELELETSIELNKIEKNKWIYLLNKTKNLFVYYVKKEEKDSFVFSDLNIKYIKSVIKNHYNKNKLLFSLGEKLDEYSKYHIINSDLINLYNNLEINYRSYDNNFQKINQRIISDSLNLSYTSLNDYYLCQYKYYLKHLLKFNKYEEKFPIIIGNLFHYILEKFYYENFDFEKEWNNFFIDKKLNAKEEVLLIKLKEEIQYIFKQLNLEKELLNINKVICEEKIKVSIKEDLTFEGKIDKIMINYPNLISVVDYKTGDIAKKLDDNQYGLNLQLPCYLYLIKNSKEYSNLEIIGFYYQQLFNKDFNEKKSLEANKSYNLKLQGYTLNDEEKVKKFDSSCENSQIVRGLKLSKELKGSLISEEEIASLIELVRNKIIAASDNIFDNNFIINPKHLKKENVSCKYCEYKDICYVKNENIVYLDGEVNDDEELD